MADEEQNQEPNEQEDKFVRMKREDIDKLQEAAKAGGTAAELQRENIFLKSGIPTDTPLGKMFYKSYDGDLTPDAIKAAATEVGLVQPSTEGTKEVNLQPGEERSTDERRAAASNASPGGVLPEKHPQQEAREKAEAIVKEGGTYEQAGAGFLSTLVKRYSEGDQRAVVDPRNRRVPPA